MEEVKLQPRVIKYSDILLLNRDSVVIFFIFLVCLEQLLPLLMKSEGCCFFKDYLSHLTKQLPPFVEYSALPVALQGWHPDHFPSVCKVTVFLPLNLLHLS